MGGAVVLAAALVAVARLMQPAPPAATAPALSPALDPIAALSPDTVYARAVYLTDHGQPVASLPYYRQALRNPHEAFWQIHFNYASALYNSTLQVVRRRGRPVPVIRSSWDRVALVREAIAQDNRAERLAQAAPDRAFIKQKRAQILWLWGLPWETLEAFRGAGEATPASAEIALETAQFTELMRSPVGGVRFTILHGPRAGP